MKMPWVSRELYEMALRQIDDLKAANAKLLDLALTKSAEPERTKEEEESMATKPHRRLVKQLRNLAEQEALEKFNRSKAS